MLDLIIWYFWILFFGVLLMPLSFYLFKNFSDYGYYFHKILSLLIISFSIWLISSLKLLSFSFPNIFFVLSLFSFLSYFLIKKKKLKIKKEILKKFFYYELFFLLIFSLLSFYRIHNSEIKDIEKFMDLAFLNAVTKTEYFPIEDPWLAGENINYYYFGYVAPAILIKLSGIKASLAFNLMIITIYTFFITSLFSLVYNLTKKYFWSFLVVFFMAFLANASCFFDLSFKENIWWASITRVIPGTINEFPLYSFLLGDLHAHFLDLPFTLLLLFLIVSIFRNKIKINFFTSLLLGVNFSVLFMTNSWDYLTYVAFFILVLIFKNKFNWDGFKKVFKIGLPIGLISLFGLSFFYFNFKPATEGIKFVTAEKTKISDFIRLFSLQIFAIGFYLWFEIKKIKKTKFFWFGLILAFIFYNYLKLASLIFFLLFLLIVIIKKEKIKKEQICLLNLFLLISFLIILFCEFFYLKDIYGIEYQRTNTIFKFYYQLWIFLNLSIGMIFYYFYQKKRQFKIKIFFLIAVLLIGLSFWNVPRMIKESIDDINPVLSLDGAKYIEYKYPHDYKAIEWMNQNFNKKVLVLELPGKSYSDDSRISSFTGMSTSIGWYGHEWGWRGYESVLELNKRVADVNLVYQSKNEEEVKKIIDKYKIDYVYIGELENGLITGKSAILGLGRLVYQNKKVKIIEF